ncbi:hypothetical protein SAMN05216566_11263 [Aureimonas phyllosphaerae]|nr:hypothetical protein SAMN05216566_11263 [Aureimonas phyllosphaerae]
MNVLQSFLNARLFDVSADDARLERLREAATDLSGTLKSSPERVASFTMVGIDREVGPDEPIVREAVAILGKRWKSYAGAFSDEQLPTVARAIILQALADVVGNDGSAAAISATSRNLLPHLGSRTDKAVWIELVSAAESRLEERATREWGLPSEGLTAPRFQVPEHQPIAVPIVNRDFLKGKMAAAVGPNDEEGSALKGANPYWPNSGQSWSHAFTPIAVDGIADVIDAVVARFAKTLDTVQTSSSIGTALQDFAQGLAHSTQATVHVLERRSRLLWWKEALFSPSSGLSYRELNPAIAAALASVDASALTGAFAPRMAEHFVTEAVRRIDPDAMTTSLSLVEMAAAVQADASPAGEACRGAMAPMHASPGRTTLASLIAGEVRIDAGVLAVRTGLEADTSMTPIGFALWLFREQQAAAATPRVAKRVKSLRR